MKEIRTYNPQTEATALLDMDEKQASIQFQQYTQKEQLAIIQTVSDPKDREQLYYLYFTPLEIAFLQTSGNVE